MPETEQLQEHLRRAIDIFHRAQERELIQLDISMVLAILVHSIGYFGPLVEDATELKAQQSSTRHDAGATQCTQAFVSLCNSFILLTRGVINSFGLDQNNTGA